MIEAQAAEGRQRNEAVVLSATFRVGLGTMGYQGVSDGWCRSSREWASLPPSFHNKMRWRTRCAVQVEQQVTPLRGSSGRVSSDASWCANQSCGRAS